MNEYQEKTQTLNDLLALKQRELDMVWAIDEIRDTIPEPGAMLSAIASLIADQFQADLILICLRNRDTGELELKVVNDRGLLLGQLGGATLRKLAGMAIAIEGVKVWPASELLSELDVAWNDGPEMEIAAVPIIIGDDQHLGAIVLTRTNHPMTPADIQLLDRTEDLVDSAVIQGYAYHDLQQRNIELETIYHIDHIRDRRLPFNQMLTEVVEEVQNVIKAEVGFLMLYNRSKDTLEMRVTTSDDNLFMLSDYYDRLSEAAKSALDQNQIVCQNDLGSKLRSLLCLPLILEDQIIGVMGVVNRYGQDGFSGDDLRLISAIGSQIDTAIFESMEQRRLRQVLGRSVDPRVMQRLLANPDVAFLRGERALLTVLYADLRGSTKLAEETEPEKLVNFINEYLGKMAETILANEGTLDKFVGDEVMALFNAPFPQEDHALRAVRVGLKMQQAHGRLMRIWKGRGVHATPLGVGIATGEMTVGEFGYSQRTDYTVIGKAANLGSRLCSAAKGGEVLICPATYELIADQIEVEVIEGLQLKGIESGMTAYKVIRVLV